MPSTADLAGAEIELIDLERRSFRLRDALQPAVQGFDYVFIDCPPSLGLLTINALVAADAVMVPLQCEFFALEGLAQFVANIERLQALPFCSAGIDGLVAAIRAARTPPDPAPITNRS